MRLAIPEPSLVVLVGASGSGKSTFAARHFKPTEVVSSDFCRALVSDDEHSMDATDAAFRVLHSIAAERLAAHRLTVIDATSVKPDSRKRLIELARAHGQPAVAIVFDLPSAVCIERNRQRAGRKLPKSAVNRQLEDLRYSLAKLPTEGFAQVCVLDSVAEVEVLTIERV